MIERILENLDENMQSGGGRHSVRPVALEMAIRAKNLPEDEKQEFEKALCEIAHAATPFSSPPNGLSVYQVTLLLGMALEAEVSSVSEIVAGNLLILNHSPQAGTAASQEIKNFCLKVLRGTEYDNDTFWIDALKSEHANLVQKSIAAEFLCDTHPELVVARLQELFSEGNVQRSALAWNIYSKVDATSEIVHQLSDEVEGTQLFLDALDVSDPSGAARSHLEGLVGVHEADNVVVLFGQLDYRRVASG